MSSIFTNLEVACIVESGSVVCITTSCISRLVKYDLPSRPMGYFMCTFAPYHWSNWCLISADRPNFTIRSRPMIISWPIPDFPLSLLTWKRCCIILLIENYVIQKRHLDVVRRAIHTFGWTVFYFIISHHAFILFSIFLLIILLVDTLSHRHVKPEIGVALCFLYLGY